MLSTLDLCKPIMVLSSGIHVLVLVMVHISTDVYNTTVIYFLLKWPSRMSEGWCEYM